MILWAVYLAGIALSCFMAWALGANDAANPTDCAVGAGAISVKRALILFAIFSALGGILVGRFVMKTFDRGIVDRTTALEAGVLTKETLVLGSLIAALAAALWVTLSTKLAMPVSTTHSAIGGVLGFGLVAAPGLIVWSKIRLILISMILSPLLSLLLAMALFRLMKYVFARASKTSAITVASILMFLILLSTAIPVVRIFLRGVWRILPISVMIAVLGTLVCSLHLFRMGDEWKERMLPFLLVVSLAFSAFAFGANDLANATGVFVTPSEIMIGKPTGTTMLYLSLLGSLFLAIGGLTWGKKVLVTSAYRITRLDPLTGFSAELANATCVFLFTTLPAWIIGFGLPISTTHSTVGAIIGAGLASGGVGSIHGETTKKILAFWAITIPCAALLSAAMFKVATFFF